MSGVLFDRQTTQRTRRTWRGGTVLASFLLHLTVLAVIAVTQLGAALEGLAVQRGIDRFVLQAAPVPPPPASRPAPVTPVTTRINPDTAPVVVPDVVLDELPPRPPAGPAAPSLDSMTIGSPGMGLPTGEGGRLELGPPVPPPTPVRVGGNIRAPERISYVAPRYPAIAQTAKVEGTVILEARIDEAGNVGQVRVLRSVSLLDQAAIEAVSQWRYSPTRLNGVAVPVLMTVTVSFTLR